MAESFYFALSGNTIVYSDATYDEDEDFYYFLASWDRESNTSRWNRHTKLTPDANFAVQRHVGRYVDTVQVSCAHGKPTGECP
ncbi:MAG: hypothetical protein GTO63_24340 [Anaerolineae bacterium]|nr:hypothetical protein [Anaerolineae bacterium]NIN97853.1 hypothetical protein [Anaerolineae bacterium]